MSANDDKMTSANDGKAASAANGKAASAANGKAASARTLVCSADPLFAALCGRALAGTSLALVAAVSPAELLTAARTHAPELLILDVDGDDLAALKTLATKLLLVSDARIVLVSGYLAPGSPGLSALLQAIAATFVQKPEGSSSLGLADGDGAPFVAALEAAFAAHEDAAVRFLALPEDFDAGWDVGDDAPGGR